MRVHGNVAVTGGFTIDTKLVIVGSSVTITATAGGVSKTAGLTVNP